MKKGSIPIVLPLPRLGKKEGLGKKGVTREGDKECDEEGEKRK